MSASISDTPKLGKAASGLRAAFAVEAARLLAAGYRVLLLDRSGRRPLTDAAAGQVHGYLDATGDPGELDRRLRVAGGLCAGIGIVTGGADAPVVVDTDGPCAIAHVAAVLGDRLATTPSETTRRGAHYFFLPDVTVRRSIHQTEVICGCAAGCGIDILGARADGQAGGYVAVAPSTGKTAVNPPGDLRHLPPLPDPLRPAPRPETATRPAGPITLPAGTDASPEGTSAVEALIATVRAAGPGRRHSATLAAASGIAGLIAAGHLRWTPGQAAAAITDALPPERRAAHRQTIGDGIAWGLAHPWTPDPILPTAGQARVEVPLSADAPTPLSVQDARSALDAAASDAVNRHLDWLRQRGGSRPVRGDGGTWRRPPRRPVPAPPPTLIQAGVGLGKTSRAIVALAAVPSLVLVRTLDLAHELAAALRQAGVPSVVHYGRHTPDLDGGEQPDDPGCCPASLRADQHGVRVTLGARRHPIMTTMCVACPEGHMAVRTIAVREGRLDAAAAADERLQAACARVGLDPAAVPDCGYLLGVDDERSAQVVIACASAYSPSLAQYEAGGVLADRLVAVDESVEATPALTVTLADIATWRDRIQALVQNSAAGIADTCVLDALTAVDGQLAGLAVAVAGATPGDHTLPDPAKTAIIEAARLAAPLLEAVGTAVRAPWETPILRWSALADSTIPLRAITDLAWAVDHDAAECDPGRAILAAAPSPLIAAITSRAAHAVILDATPDPTLELVVAAAGGYVTRAVPDQPAHIEIASRRAWTRGRYTRPDTGDAALRSDAATVLQLTSGRDVAAIATKPLAEAAAALGALDVGWYGRDDRGTNRYAGRDIVLVGQELLPPDTERRAWTAHRAIAHDAGIALPEWTAERVAVTVETTPGAWIDSPVKLSADPTIRTWQMTRLSADRAQALGRMRALWHPDVEALIVGVPTWLAPHGYSHVRHIDEPPETTAGRDDIRAAAHLEAWARIAAASLELARRGERVSRRAVVTYLHALTLPGPSGTTWRAWLAAGGDNPAVWALLAQTLLDDAAELTVATGRSVHRIDITTRPLIRRPHKHPYRASRGLSIETSVR